MAYTLEKAEFLQAFYLSLAIGKPLSGTINTTVDAIVKNPDDDKSYEVSVFAPDDNQPGGGFTLPLEDFVHQYSIIPIEEVLKILG